MNVCINRPLTADDIAQRREMLRQKQQGEKTETTGEKPPETPVEEATNVETNENQSENVFLAFARVFSGRLRRGQKIFVLSPRHDPALFIGKVNFHSNKI